MSHDHDQQQDGAQLDVEERALAERLARAAPLRGPSAALDTRILGAARDAVATDSRASPPGSRTPRGNTSRRPTSRRRWPAFAGAAAVVVLAVGVAWQLRPVDELQATYSEGPAPSEKSSYGGPNADDMSSEPVTRSPETSRTSAPASVADEAADASPPETIQSRPQTPVQEISPAPTRVEEERAEDKAVPSVQARAAPPAAAAEAPPVVFDQPSPMDTPPPPPAPPAPLTPRSDGAAPAVRSTRDPAANPSAADDAMSGSNQPRTQSAPMASPPRARKAEADQPATAIGTRSSERRASESQLDRIEVTGSRLGRFGDQPIDDQPPASADSRDVRTAWLQRIRALLADGDREAARDSLREFRRRHPDVTLPDDLRPLLDE